MNSTPVREAWLITGIPGAGKTTVARGLASSTRRAAHIEGDRLGEWIISGRVDPGQQPAREAERQIRLNIRNQCLLARAYARAGFVPFLDFPVVSHAHRLQAYRRALRRHDFYLVVLNPGRAVALQRDAIRPEKTVAHLWVHMEDTLLREPAGFGLWIDTAHLSVQQTIDQILSQKEQALLDNATP